ncbi:MAG: flagellar biosynthesis regulator FlaF [Pseudomonadota bacterium]
MPPRELEAHLLVKAAMQLQDIQDNWEDLQGSLNDALYYNRRLWAVFVDAVTAEESHLPKPVAQNIANLGFFVFNHTLQVQLKKQPSMLSPLISINREIATGLRSGEENAGTPEAESQPPAA